MLERINAVLGNLVWKYNTEYTYIDEDDLWSVVLAAAALPDFSTANILKGYSMGKLVFRRDIILLIKHEVDW